jgi:nicotinamidase-related amidase
VPTTNLRASPEQAAQVKARARNKGVPVAYVTDAAIKAFFSLPEDQQDRGIREAGVERHSVPTPTAHVLNLTAPTRYRPREISRMCNFLPADVKRG